MFREYTKYVVLEPFFYKPNKKFYLRELSRLTGVSYPAVRNRVNQLQQSGFIRKVGGGIYDGYKANVNPAFKRCKRFNTVQNIYESGIVDDIKQTFFPSSIVLFGSAAKGEDTEKSDIDILIVAEKKPFDASIYEEHLRRPIDIQCLKPDALKQAKPLANSVANGIVLDGFLTIL